MPEIIFLRNKLEKGGLSLVCALQANYFYRNGFNVTILCDQSYKKGFFDSQEVKLFDKGIKIIPCLTTDKYKYQTPQVNKKNEKKNWFGGSITKYYDEYGHLVKISWHDSNGWRVKIKFPIIEKYLSNLKNGDIVIAMEASLGWYLGSLNLPNGVTKSFQIHNQHFYLEDWIDNSEQFKTFVLQTPKAKIFYEEKYGKKKNIIILNPTLRIEIPKQIVNYSERKNKIIFVGRLEEGKQPLDAIKTFHGILQQYSNYNLYIYGEGSMLNKCKKLVASLNIKDKVFFKGYETDLNKIFMDAKLMLFPTKRESFGMVIIEAFAYGVPVIAYSTYFGVDDLIENRLNGYLIPQGNINEMIDKSISILNLDYNSIQIIIENIREKALNYEYNKTMPKYLEYLELTSNIKIDKKELLLNRLKNIGLPSNIIINIQNKNFSLTILKEIISHFEKAKAKIINGKLYIYNIVLIEKYNFTLEDLMVND